MADELLSTVDNGIAGLCTLLLKSETFTRLRDRENTVIRLRSRGQLRPSPQEDEDTDDEEQSEYQDDVRP